MERRHRLSSVYASARRARRALLGAFEIEGAATHKDVHDEQKCARQRYTSVNRYPVLNCYYINRSTPRLSGSDAK
jgi:hypothetical protein